MTARKKATEKRTGIERNMSAEAAREEAWRLAEVSLRPSVNATLVISEHTKAFGSFDLAGLNEALSGSIQQIQAGDLRGPEAMLYAQAHALQAIFTNLAHQAAQQKLASHWEMQLRMALKAQNQCRMTLETLALLKQPRVLIAQQANINHSGQQQVNNGTGPLKNAQARADTPAQENPTEPNELLERPNEQPLDSRAPGQAGRTDSQLETMGASHRPAKRRG